ncbi:50S ribosomal protein L25 [Chloroflexota bacterium]
MEQIELQASNRETLGKKVRFLRRQGLTPVHLFGHGIQSEALQCDTVQLQQVLAQAGKTRLIGLKLDKAKKLRNVIVREIQTEPRTGNLVHVDFYQVKMAQKIKMEVPIILVGEAPALKLRENMLMQELNSLTVECLPDQIPNSVELDISYLAEADQVIRVKDIALDKEIAVLNDPDHMIVKISVQPVEKVEEVEEEVEVEEEITEEVAEAPEAARPSGEKS